MCFTVYVHVIVCTHTHSTWVPNYNYVTVYMLCMYTHMTVHVVIVIVYIL